MGGSKTEVVQAPPAPSAGETAKDVYQARLQYDLPTALNELNVQQQTLPGMTELQSALMKQYSPQLAQLYTDIQAQQMPQLQALQAQLFPQQSQVLEAGAGQALAGLQAPQAQGLQQQGLEAILGQLQQPMSPLQQAMTQQAMSMLQGGGVSPEQQSAIDAIRQRQIEQYQRDIRNRANLGGSLYGGRPEQMEMRGVGELRQNFAAEDVARQYQNMQLAAQIQGLQQQAQQQAIQNAFAAQQQLMNQAQPFINILYPQAAQAGNVNTQPFQFQSAVPDANAQLQAVTNLLGQQAVMPGQSSDLWGLAGSLLGAAGTAASGGGTLLSGFSSKRYKKNIKLWEKR